MPAKDDILDLLRTIPDPEMPISIVDLGIVEQIAVVDDAVTVTILPTFVGCPALDMIAEQIREKLVAMPDIRSVDVRFVFDPPWSVRRITPEGRASLKAHGVTVPAEGSQLEKSETVPLHTSAVTCPYCDSSDTRLESPFGPTRCRMIYYCQACRNMFEHMKQVAM